MIVRRHAEGKPRRHLVALALALGLLLALAVPALASAADIEVTGTGDTTTTSACETSIGECTLRGAVALANAEANLDEITFAPSFDGGSGSTIALGSGLTISQPVEILDTVIDEPTGPIPAATIKGGAGIVIANTASGTVVEGLGIEITGPGIGVEILGDLDTEVLDNFISGAQAAIEVNNSGVNTGANLIEGNKIQVPYEFNFGVVTQVGGNHIFGNEIEGTGCCYTGIWIDSSSSGNQIGGDTTESENVITGFSNGSIYILAGGNEVGRNRGSGGGEFLHGAGSTPPPTLVTARKPKVTGTGEPGAKVRVFATQSASLNEIEGFVGEAIVGGSGEWEVSLASVPVGRLVTATETLSGETSGFSSTLAVTAEPSTGGGGGTGEGGNDSGSSSSGGGTTTTPTPPPATATSTPAKPMVKIVKGPKKASTSTTAKFTFKATNVSGAKFECRLDSSRWASCKSPKTYKRLKPKTHTFQVRAKAAGSTGAVAKFKFTVEP